MSMIRCDTCASLIDTDENPDAYCGESDSWSCEACDTARVAYWRGLYDAAPLSERNPEQYRRDMIAAGRGHLLGDGD